MANHRRPGVLVLMAVAAAACAGPRGTPRAAGNASPATIHLSKYVGLLRSMQVTAGRTTSTFIFDTGGGETCITPELAGVLGCTPYGRMVGFRMSGEQVIFQYCDHIMLGLGGLGVTHERVAVFDLKSILPPDIPRADGVVSLRSFRDRPITVNLTAGAVTVETPESLALRTRSMRPITVRVATGPTGAETTVYLAARVGGERAWFLLDSGNGDALLIAPHVARTARLQGTEGEVLIDFDGLGPIHLPVRTNDMIYDGVLGVHFIQNWIFTFDLVSGRAWAAKP